MDLNISPYYDDFDGTKNFQRILFRPGRSVQGRELTQMQTALQDQLKKLGDNLLVDGTPVLNAQMKVDFNKHVIVLSDQDTTGDPLIPADWVGQYFSSPNGSGQVTHVDTATRSAFFDYRGGEIKDGDVLTTFSATGGAHITRTATVVSQTVGVYAYQEEGVIYAGGYFVHVPEQSVMVDNATNDGSYRIGFNLTEEIKNSDNDGSLLDPANGSPNHNAPGADRLEVTCVPVSYKSSETASESFYPMIIVENGKIIKQSESTQYSSILDTMAQRTYDESGDYTVKDFPILISEHDSDVDKIKVSLEPGKAYVKGYENHTLVTSHLETDRARTTADINNESIETVYGPYIKIATDANGRLDMDNMIRIQNKPMVDLYSETEKVGTARVISADRGGDSKIRLYLADFAEASALINSVTEIREQGSHSARRARIESGPLNGIEMGSQIYSLSQSPISSVVDNETSYERITSYHNVAASSANTFEIFATDNYTSFPSEGVVMITRQDGTPLTTSEYSAASTIRNGGLDSVVITVPSGATAIDVTIRQSVSQGNWNTKTLTRRVDTFTLSSGTEHTFSQFDLFRVISITADGADVPLENYTYDNGQRDTYYDFWRMGKLTAGVAYSVTYDYFEHSGTGDYFCVNSYTTANNLTSEPQIYSMIPEYFGTTGLYFNLRDSLDFRRTKTANDGGATIVRPQGQLRVDYSYYLPRKDRIYIDQTGAFHVVNGIAGNNPELPESMDGAMLLYNLVLPAYTFSPEDIEIEHLDNQRYTMRDIGKLEKRLDVMEYYTSLSLLESRADTMQVTDGDGFTKHKNGILVDSFVGHGVGNISHIEYRCSMDSENGVLRTPFKTELFDLVQGTGSANVKIHPHIATVDYTKAAWITQDLVSEFSNVNPYNVFNWIGQMTMTPSTDNWVDTTRLPAVTTNFEGQNDAMTKQIELMKDLGYLSTNWNSWQNTWSGSKQVTSRSTSVDYGQWSTTSSTRETGHGRSGGGNPFQGRFGSGWGSRPYREMTTTTTSRRNVKTTTRTNWSQNVGQRRSGTTVQVVPGTIKKSTGDKVVDTTIIPWMREKEVKFEVAGLKPSVKMVASFDGIAITAECKPDGGNYGDELKTNTAGSLKGTFKIPAGKFRTGARVFRLEDNVISPTTSAVFTYEASGLMQTKQETIISVDNPQIVPKTVTQDRVIQKNGTWTSTSNNTQTSTSSSTKTEWYDPLAQSFIVAETTGVFVESIDLFFRTKDSALPVTVFIVETENGYPSQRRVPFSEVSLTPNLVNIDPAGRSATNFKFTDPVYLQGGTEYAFVIMSNSNQYEVGVGKIGGNQFRLDTTSNTWKNDGPVVSKQPYTGVMFKSQNASTWSADQERDLKFVINRCVFNTNSANLNLKCKDLRVTNQDGFDLTTMMLNVDTLRLADTQMTFKVGLVNVNMQDVENKTNYEMSTVSKLESTDAGVDPIRVEANMKCSNSYASPVVNLQRNGLVGVSNVVVGEPSDALKNAGTYVSHTVNLANPSDDIRVYLDTQEPTTSEVKVYFKTTQYTPRHVIATDSIGNQYSGEHFQIYWEKGKKLAYKASFIATDIKGTTIGISQLTDATALIDPATNGDVDNVYIVRSDIQTMKEYDDWSSGDYEAGSVVMHNGQIFVASDKVENSDGEPTINSVVWILQPHVTSTGTVQELETEEWREMKALNNTNNAGQYTEKTYIPVAKLDSEFSSFSVKIELMSPDEINVPTARAMRVMAMF